MCGILGAVGSPDEIREECLLQGLAGLSHRGPDDSGWHVIRQSGPQPTSIFLGNRRLAILDLLPVGHQPMQDRDTGSWITTTARSTIFERFAPNSLLSKLARIEEREWWKLGHFLVSV